MKKYFFTILLLALANALVYAQVTIQPNVPAVGIIQKNQLWNVLIVNSSNNSYFDCRLNLLLRDRATGQEIFAATTASFNIDAGVKQLNINTLNPVQYNYLSGVANNNLQGLISTGSYTACYSLIYKPLDIAEECIQFDTEPLSPPMLIFPADSSVLDIAPAQFSWTAPTPAEMFDRLHYEILITEIQDGQKANEAIQQNLPFYNDGTLFNNVLNYPSSSKAFEKEKWYAWQVVARDDKAYAGKSEVWVFKVTAESKKEKIIAGIYLQLDDEIKGTYQISEKILHIKYASPFPEYTAQIIFNDEKGNTIQTIKQIIKQGENYFNFSLNHQFKSNSIQRLTLNDRNNKHHSLTFSISTK